MLVGITIGAFFIPDGIFNTGTTLTKVNLGVVTAMVSPFVTFHDF